MKSGMKPYETRYLQGHEFIVRWYEALDIHRVDTPPTRWQIRGVYRGLVKRLYFVGVMMSARSWLLVSVSVTYESA